MIMPCRTRCELLTRPAGGLADNPLDCVMAYESPAGIRLIEARF